jgi:hypothetical protein
MAADRSRDEIRIPVTEAIKILAREAGFAAGKELLRTHVETCEALKALPEIKKDVAILKTDMRPLKRARLCLHWAVGAVGAGVLYASGQWVWHELVRRI